jgi:hypothetical protein
MSFTFYFTVGVDELRDWPCVPDVPVLLPASSYARRGLQPPRLPAHVTQRAADSGGFVATFKWGDYLYSPEQYVQWLRTWNPQWAATMDYCCEPEVLGKQGIVRERQQRTTDMAWLFWSRYRDCLWAWVPTIQGWEVADYRRHAREMKPLIDEMQSHYGADSSFRVGIGTLCRRASAEMIRSVVLAVSEELGDVPLHLWGVKLSLFQSGLALPTQVASSDSAAFWFSHAGGWQAAHEEMRSWSRQRGKTHRHYMYEVAMPRYQAKIDAALSSIKQARMF